MPPAHRFELAQPQDDAALREILRRTPMPGRVAMATGREPSFFAGEAAGNLGSQAIVARETASGAVAGLGCRSWRRVYIDGMPRVCGYLSGLRGLPAARGGVLLARGYQFLKELHRDGRAPYYFTTILNENESARRVLASGRAGLPIYQPVGKLHTYLLPLYARRFRGPVRRDSPGLSGEIIDAAVRALNNFNSGHQFAPVYTRDDLEGRTGLLPGFDTQDFMVAQAENGIAATLGVWSQSEFRQWVVAGYAWPYRIARPLTGLGAALGVAPPLPAVGQPIPCVYAAFLSHTEGQENRLDQLLRAAQRGWSGRGYTYLVAGASEGSPLSRILSRRATAQLVSSIYLVFWDDLLSEPLPQTSRPPHLEVATL